ncbi:MAG: threonine--tRNA ligase, partial [candidate division SR1 bacterium]
AKDNVLRGINPEYLAYYEKVTTFLQEKYPEKFADKFVTFLDMCEGPHVENTKFIDVKQFKLDKLAGAYWKGDANNVMMTRIYAHAFENKQQLQEHIAFLEEAKKRDHRTLGQKLKIFTMSPLIGSGLPLLQPNGMVIRQEVENYLWELHRTRGYDRVRTPHIAKISLYETSGHAAKFGDELFKVKGKEEDFIMKPMNCPHHMQIFADNQFSYRDMPIRYFEPATVYRDEKTGQLSGLTRVRSITQDDGHLFCRVDQIKDEVKTITDIIKEFYGTMGMLGSYWVSLSVRGDDKSKYLGEDKVWEIAEASLEEAAKLNDLPYKRVEGEAAFYGPKLDFMFKDCLGRERQLATIQCDFNLPERFKLEFTNQDGEKERPVVIHRAIAGSLERFMGIMIEHFAGAFPVWMAPTQVKIIPVAEPFNDYAQGLKQKLQSFNIRAKVDTSSDSFSKKIRNGELEKIPYLLIVGQQELDNNSVNYRAYKDKKQEEMKFGLFVDKIVKERDCRSL